MPFSFTHFQAQAQKTLDHIKTDIATLRTGKAAVQLLDPVMVEAYGTHMRIAEVASLQAPDPTLLVVSPWDKSLLEAIVKGIMTAGLNLNPVVDGEIIRISVPPLTEETRKDMVKKLHQKIEGGKVMLRHLRSDVKKDIEDQKTMGGVSEDDIERDLAELEKQFQKHIDAIENLSSTKEKELLTV